MPRGRALQVGGGPVGARAFRAREESGVRPSLPAGLVRRAEIVLNSAAGATRRATAAAVGVSLPLVAYWRRRFRVHRLAGLYDAPRLGQPRTHDDDEVAQLLRTVLRTRPPTATQWSVRGVAANWKWFSRAERTDDHPSNGGYPSVNAEPQLARSGSRLCSATADDQKRH